MTRFSQFLQYTNYIKTTLLEHAAFSNVGVMLPTVTLEPELLYYEDVSVIMRSLHKKKRMWYYRKSQALGKDLNFN